MVKRCVGFVRRIFSFIWIFMFKDNEFKGYFWTFVSVLAVSNVYIFSKSALNQISIIQFGFYWFGFGLIWNFLYLIWKSGLRPFKDLKKSAYKLLIVLGFLEIIGTTAFFYSIKVIENPAVTSFLQNLSPIFVTTLGVIILKERFNKIEIIGIVLTLIGTFAISYRGGSSISNLFIYGSQFVVVSTFTFAIIAVIIKKYIDRLTPSLLSYNRGVFIFTFAAILMVVTEQSVVIPGKALIDVGIGSLLGPFLTVIAGYNALKYIEVSKKSILSSSRGLFVLIGAYVYFGKLPLMYQIVGGLITIAGVVLIAFGKTLLKRK